MKRASPSSAEIPAPRVLLGYARVSTADQDPGMQVTALRAAGASRIWTETASGARTDRPELRALLEQVRPSDTVLVWKLDRLARSLADLLRILRELESRGAGLRSLTEAIDTTSAAGRLLIQMLGALGEFELSLIRERSRAGAAAARAAGRVGGRRRKLTHNQIMEARRMIERGETVSHAAAVLKVHGSTLQRTLARDAAATGVAVPTTRRQRLRRRFGAW